MTTATKPRPVNPEIERQYVNAVAQLAASGESVDVSAAGNILARSGRSGADLLADVKDRRRAVREKAARQIAEAQRLKSEDGAQADAAVNREAVELAALEKEFRERIDAKRRALSQAQATANSLGNKAARLNQQALETLNRTADPGIAQRQQSIAAEIDREKERIEEIRRTVWNSRDRNATAAEFGPEIERRETRVRELTEESARLQTAKLQPESFVV